MNSQLEPMLEAMIHAIFYGYVVPANAVNDQVPPTINNNNEEEQEEEEEEDEPTNNVEPATVGIATTSSSSSLDRTATTLNSILRSSSTATSLSSVSSSQSGLGDQSNKGNSVGNGNTQSNLNGGNGELESQGEEESNLGYEAEDEEENEDEEEVGERNDPNPADQEEVPSLNESASQGEPPAQVGGNNNGGDQDSGDVNLSDVSAGLGDLVSRHSDQGSQGDHADWGHGVIVGEAEQYNNSQEVSEPEVEAEVASESEDGNDGAPLSVPFDDRISDLLRKIGFEAAGNVISEDFIVSEINKELTSSDRDALNNLGAGDKESVINEVRKFADIFRHILVREDESGVDQAASTVATSPVHEAVSIPFLDALVQYSANLLNASRHHQGGSQDPEQEADRLFDEYIQYDSPSNLFGDGSEDSLAPAALIPAAGGSREGESGPECQVQESISNAVTQTWFVDGIDRLCALQNKGREVCKPSVRAVLLEVLPQIDCQDRTIDEVIELWLMQNPQFVLKIIKKQFFSFDGSDISLPPMTDLLKELLLSKDAAINIAGNQVSFRALDSEKVEQDSLMRDGSKVFCQQVFDIIMGEDVGVNESLKILEAAAGMELYELVLQAAKQSVHGCFAFSFEISHFIGRAIRKANAFTAVSLALESMEEDFQRRQATCQYIEDARSWDTSYRDIARTLEWGSFLVGNDMTRSEGIISYLGNNANHIAFRRLLVQSHLPPGQFDPTSAFQNSFDRLLADWNAGREVQGASTCDFEPSLDISF